MDTDTRNQLRQAAQDRLTRLEWLAAQLATGTASATLQREAAEALRQLAGLE
jgi:hypothetical protein